MQTKKTCTLRLNYFTAEMLNIISNIEVRSQADIIEGLVRKYWYDSKLEYDHNWSRQLEENVKKKYNYPLSLK